MIEDKFLGLPAVFRSHPITGEKLNPVRTTQILDNALSRISARQIPEFVHQKNAQLGITQINSTIPVEEMGWQLDVVASDNIGLVINSVFYQDEFFIFNMHLPWLAIGTPCKFEKRYFLDRRIAGPFVYVFDDGFLIWARYGFGHFSTVDQAYYFLSNGVCFPLIQLTSPDVINFVPIPLRSITHSGNCRSPIPLGNRSPVPVVADHLP